MNDRKVMPAKELVKPVLCSARLGYVDKDFLLLRCREHSKTDKCEAYRIQIPLTRTNFAQFISVLQDLEGLIRV